MNLTEATEIRKLNPSLKLELVRLLDENWKTLMTKIPERLERENYECVIEANNTPKYNSGHIRLIEQASNATKRLASDILFEEWGSSGRVRPTLGHLFILLQDCKLYRAADFIAQMVGKSHPNRPHSGPAAKVELTPTERRQLADSHSNIINILEDIEYPTTIIEKSDAHLIANDLRQQTIPDIDLENTENSVDRSVFISDMIQFSSERVPHISNLLNSGTASILGRSNYTFAPQQESNTNENGTKSRQYSAYIPQFVLDNTDGFVSNVTTPSINIVSETSELDSSEMPSHNVPCISNLLYSESETFQSSQDKSAQPVIPRLSALLTESSLSKSANLPNLSMLNETVSTTSNPNYNIVDFNALRNSGTSATGSENTSVPQTLGSPLPTLSLNTLLKHYPYAQLEIATNYFNETPYTNTQTGEFNAFSGRLLGSGAFGSVYLAFGILDRPIAVKRINLQDLNIVRANDMVTKQFSTEVEILYKYKHDHLLSLLGYSCDGMTYCLLYEYIPGGNLKDRLQCTANTPLNWIERFNIAMGTADAVAYLHTAYAAPLIHRDIKSANILLDAANQPKLCDFGIIRMSSSTTTGTKQILGTSAYMPPEAHRGDVSVKMDTYSFGVVLLELLTGLPPVDYERNGNDIVTYVQDNLEDENDVTLLLDTKAGTWHSGTKNYGSELYQIAVRCLQERKNVRPTMVEVRDELAKLLTAIKISEHFY